MSDESILPANSQSSLSIRTWLIVILIALLIHLGVLLSRMDWFLSSHLPAPMQVQTISDEELQKIKRSWESQKKFILKQSQPETTEPVPNARFESDKRSRVANEQKARNTNVIPQEAVISSKAQSEKVERQKSVTLSNLGIKMNFAKQAEQRSESVARNIAPRVFEDQSLAEKNLAEGERNLLNTERSTYYSFYARLYEAIAPLWDNRIRDVTRLNPNLRPVPNDYTTVAEIILDPSGNLIDVRILVPSGVPEFDRAVTDSWKKISRFPNPPRGLIKEDGFVHTAWTFTVSVSDNPQWRFLTPERQY